MKGKSVILISVIRILGFSSKNPNPGDFGFFGILASGFFEGKKSQIPGIQDLGIGIPKYPIRKLFQSYKFLAFPFHALPVSAFGGLSSPDLTYYGPIFLSVFNEKRNRTLTKAKFRTMSTPRYWQPGVNMGIVNYKMRGSIKHFTLAE